MILCLPAGQEGEFWPVNLLISFVYCKDNSSVDELAIYSRSSQPNQVSANTIPVTDRKLKAFHISMEERIPSTKQYPLY